MVAIGKKKYQSGEGAQFLTRKAAMKKLQLSLKDFRKLCILKGIYPREPRNRKRAQKGKQGIKTLYHIKDVQFLLHEPIIWKLREYKIFSRKVGRAKAMKDFSAMKRYLANHPTIKLDHIVKERYPTFIDALRDLDDCLTLCFLFSTFPSLAHIPRDQSALCRKLTTEFMHAVIAGNALRKVFVSIKGYYYQAEIKGQTITWIVPHNFSFQPQSRTEVDFKIMSTFVEFYIVMLGFVNFRLYHSLNLFYPPKLTVAGVDSEKILVDEEAYVDERVAALSVPLVSLESSGPVEEIADEFPVTDHPDAEQMRIEAEKKRNLKSLFKDLKFFINREVPRQELVFSILALGGKVSWDKMMFVGATFDENDESITHHIVDRPSMEKKYMSRYYVQPQWVFDSINAMELLPVEQYLMGAVLPPHLSPFSNNLDQVYMPPEERAMKDPSYKMTDWQDEEEEEDDEEEQDQEEEEDQEEKEEEVQEEVMEEEEDGDELDKEKLRMKKKKNMKVKPGEIVKEEPWAKAKQEKQEFRLREKMIPRKHRGLYKSMKAGQEKRAKEIWLLRKKRRLHDEQTKKAAKEAKKQKA